MSLLLFSLTNFKRVLLRSFLRCLSLLAFKLTLFNLYSIFYLWFRSPITILPLFLIKNFFKVYTSWRFFFHLQTCDSFLIIHVCDCFLDRRKIDITKWFLIIKYVRLHAFPCTASLLSGQFLLFHLFILKMLL